AATRIDLRIDMRTSPGKAALALADIIRGPPQQAKAHLTRICRPPFAIDFGRVPWGLVTARAVNVERVPTPDSTSKPRNPCFHAKKAPWVRACAPGCPWGARFPACPDRRLRVVVCCRRGPRSRRCAPQVPGPCARFARCLDQTAG